MTTLRTATRPADTRCHACGAVAETPRPSAEIVRLFHALSPHLRVVLPVRDYRDPAWPGWRKTDIRRGRRALQKADATARYSYLPEACRLFPLHYEDATFQIVGLHWTAREAPGRTPTFDQFCRAYGLRCAPPATDPAPLMPDVFTRDLYRRTREGRVFKWEGWS